MSQEFLIRSGIHMEVTGASELVAALRQMQAETQRWGSATMASVAAAQTAWNNYAFNRGAQVQPLKEFAGAVDPAAEAAAQLAREAQQAANAIDDNLNAAMRTANRDAQELRMSLTVLGVAAAATGAKMVEMSKDATMDAARAQELDIVLRNMSETLGYNVQAIKQYEEAIKGLNIRTDAARNILLLFMRMNLDVAKATTLARVAQDAAVISMEESSDALEGILHGIMTLQPRVLRTHGIIVNLDATYKEWAHTMGTTVESLSMEEKQQIALNEVLKQGVRLTGTYESAMTSASKHLRSVTQRELYELRREFGEGLVPALGQAVDAAQVFTDKIQAWPDALQGTISKMVAFSGILLSASGSMMVYAANSERLVGALTKVGFLQAGARFGIGPMGWAMGAVGVAATIVAVTKSIEEAQDKQAASAVDTGQSYGEYISQLGKAKDTNLELSYAIWKVIDAQRAQGNAPTGEEVSAAIREIEKYTKGFYEANRRTKDDLANLSELALEYGQVEEQVTKIVKNETRGLGLSKKEIDDRVHAIMDLVKAEQIRRKELAKVIDEERRWFNHFKPAIPLFTEAERKSRALAAAIDAITTAMEGGIVSRYTDFISGLAGALGEIRGIDQEFDEMRSENKKTLTKMGVDMSKSMKELAKDLAKAVPDATAEEARLEQGILGLGTWDEWARRWAAAQDFVFSEQEKGWLEFTQAQVEGTKWALMEGETSYEWMARLREGFYAGDEILIDKFANKQTAAFKWQQILNAEKLSEKKAELDAEFAAKKRELDLELQYEQEALEKKRKWSMVEQALALAGGTLALENWAKKYAEKAGAPQLWEAFADPKKLYDMIQEGVVSLDDPELKKVIDTYGTGLTQALGNTQTVVDDNTASVDALNDAWGRLQQTLSVAPNYQPMQYKAGRPMPYQPTTGAMGELAGGLAGFQGLAQDLVGTTFPAIANANMITVQDMEEKWSEFERWVYGVMYGHSVVPTLEKAMEDWGKITNTTVDTVILPAIQRVIDALETVATTLGIIMGTLSQPLTGGTGGLPITPPIDEGEVGYYGAGPTSGASPSGPVRQSTMQQIAGQMEMLPQNIATEISHAPIVSGAGAGMGGGTYNNEVYYMQFSDPAAWAMAQMTVANNRRARLDSRMVG